MVKLIQRAMPWLLSLASAGALAVMIGATWWNASGAALRCAALLVLALTVLLAPLTFLLGYRFAWRHTARLRPATRWMLLGLGVVIGLVITLLIAAPTVPGVHQLEIRATGEKNPNSSGSKVWLQAMRLGDERILPMKALQTDGEWKRRSAGLYVNPEEPARLTWVGRTGTNLILRFATLPEGGLVKIVWDGTTKTIDLFSPSPGSTIVHLEALPVTSSIDRLLNLLFSLAAVWTWSWLAWFTLVLGWIGWERFTAAYNRKQVNGNGSGGKAKSDFPLFFICGIMLFSSVGSAWLTFGKQPWPWRAAAVLLGGYALGLLIGTIYIKLSQRYLEGTTRRKVIAWWLAALAVAGLLLLALPPSVIAPDRPGQLEIIASGERNPQSQGSEVWLIAARRQDNSIVRPQDMQLETGWELRDGLALSFENQPAILSWQGKLDPKLSLSFISHPWSGVAIIRLGELEQRIDLFSPVAGQKTIELSNSLWAGQPVSWKLWLAWLYLAMLVSAANLFFIISVWLVKRTDAPLRQPRRADWLWYALAMAAVWLVFWLVYWPGIMSVDSIVQWQEVLRGHFTDAHPAFHTWSMWLISRIWLNPAAVGLAQIAALALVAGFGFGLARRLGVARPAVLVGVALFALSLPNALMVITIWKDVAFSIAFLGLVILWIKITASDGAWLKQPINLVLLTLVLILTALFRHNGLPAVAFALGLLIVFRKGYRLRLALVGLAFLGAWAFIKGPVYRWAKIPSATTYFEVVYELLHIAAHLESGTSFSTEQKAFLNQITPIDPQLGWAYDCNYQSSLIYAKNFRRNVAYGNPGQVRSLFLDSLKRNPSVNLAHMLCSSALVWQISNQGTWLATVPIEINNQGQVETISQNNLGLREDSKLPVLLAPLSQFFINSQVTLLGLLIWRPAIYLYLFLFGLLVLWARTGKASWLQLSFPVLGLALSMFLVNGAQAYRYMYPIYVVAMASWPLLYFSAKSKDAATRW